jgi:hypothetical protein
LRGAVVAVKSSERSLGSAFIAEGLDEPCSRANAAWGARRRGKRADAERHHGCGRWPRGRLDRLPWRASLQRTWGIFVAISGTKMRFARPSQKSNLLPTRQIMGSRGSAGRGRGLGKPCLNDLIRLFEPNRHLR